MKRLTGLFVLTLASLVPVVEGADGPMGLVRKSIDAMGGEDALAKTTQVQFSDTGKFYGMGAAVDYQGTHTLHMPDKFRAEIQYAFTLVVSGEEGWIESQGTVTDMTADQLKEQKEAMYRASVQSLVPLTKDDAFKLSAADSKELNGKPTKAIKVAHEGHRDVTLYFDTENHFLVGMEAIVVSPEQGDKEVSELMVMKDFKKVEGANVAMSVDIQRDGKPYVESRVTEFKFTKQVDAKLFEKP